MDLTKLESNAEKIVDKVWGKEIWLVNNKKYCSKILLLNKQHRCSIHYHKNKTETFIVLEGLILMELNKKNLILKPGDILTLNPGDKHRFTGLQNSLFQEVSTFHEDSDSYREVESGKVSDKNFQKLLNLYK